MSEEQIVLEPENEYFGGSSIMEHLAGIADFETFWNASYAPGVTYEIHVPDKSFMVGIYLATIGKA